MKEKLAERDNVIKELESAKAVLADENARLNDLVDSMKNSFSK
jgi:hypothetical protein